MDQKNLNIRDKLLSRGEDELVAMFDNVTAATKNHIHTMVPLPFNPAKLKGISEKLITSHWKNNYGTAVKSLVKVQQQLQGITKDVPAFTVAGLRERELNYANSIVYHEHYFGNLGGDGKPSGTVIKAIDRRFGSYDRWEEIFRATGMSLSGASGWVVLEHNFHLNDLRITWASNHTQSSVFGQPLLVLDMYEHAYQMDYGASADKYIDAFFKNINWDIVNKLHEFNTNQKCPIANK